MLFLTTVVRPEVDPEDVFLISILLQDGLQALLEPINGGLASPEDGEARELRELSRISVQK